MAGPQRNNSFNQYDEQSFNYSQQHDMQIPQPSHQYESVNEPPQPPAHRAHPGMHPASQFSDMQSQRQYGIPQDPPPTYTSSPTRQVSRRPINQSPVGQDESYAARRQSFTTPGTDNLGQRAAGGGIAGIAMGVAGSNERESGVQALRDVENWGRTGPAGVAGATASPAERQMNDFDYGPQNGAYDPYLPTERAYLQQQPSSTSLEPLAGAAYHPGSGTPGVATPHTQYSDRHTPYDPYHNQYSGENLNAYFNTDPYSNRFSASQSRLQPGLAPINPNEIMDDDDDGLGYANNGPKRRSFLGIGGRPASGTHAAPALGAVAGAGAAGAAAATLAHRDGTGYYGPVPGSTSNLGSDSGPEKSEWLNKQSTGRKKLTWIVGIIIAIIIIGAVLGGILAGVVFKKNGGSTSSSNGASASDVTEDNKTDLNKNSAEIKALMNNANLHKVFPGIDYTPMNAQYPDCLNVPPSQNNVTRDMAVLSQMTNAVRLYGTDCNQTQMVIHAIKQLELASMKVWLGVYLDSNQTTNTRQLNQMWDILDEYGADPFKGVIVGNEVLFRKDLTSAALGEILAEVKTNLTNKNLDLPLGSSDLGDNWTADLAQSVDIVMANIHPFFAGVTAEEAAGWTWDFWQGHDVIVTQGMTGKSHVISEVGWPSAGGNDCGAATCTSDTQGSIAGIDEMNTFMDTFICQALTNGTDFFW